MRPPVASDAPVQAAGEWSKARVDGCLVSILARAARDEEPSRALRGLVAGVRELCAADAAVLYVRSGPAGAPTLEPVIAQHAAASGLGLEAPVDMQHSAAGRVAATGDGLVLCRGSRACEQLAPGDPVRCFDSAVLVPVALPGAPTATGVLQCGRWRSGAPRLSAGHREALESVAAAAGSVMLTLALGERLMAAQRKASALVDLANASRQAREEGHVHVPDLVERVLLSVYKIMRADRVSLYLSDTAKRELWCCVSKDYQGSRIKFGVGIIGTVANTGKALNVRDCYEDRRFYRQADAETGYETRSMLAVPVCSREGALLAVIAVINKVALRGSDAPLLPPLGTAKGPRGPGKRGGTQDALHALDGAAFPDASVVPQDVAGTTYFTREDEAVLESISTEVGSVLERNALDTHYECVLRQVLDMPSRDIRNVITASLLAETTTSGNYQRGVASLNSPAVSGPKARLVRLVWRNAVFLRALGKFMRMLRRARGFHFPVARMESCRCCAAARPKSFRKRRARSMPEGLEHWHRPVAAPSAKATSQAAAQARDTALAGAGVTPAPAPAPALREVNWGDRAGDYCLNVFELPAEDGVELLYHGLSRLGLAERFGIPRATALSLARSLRAAYLGPDTCPYHNWDHGLAVYQMTYATLWRTALRSILSPGLQLALLVAALAHDAGHEGRNNDFEIKVGSELAMRYNDKSVLEQHHASVLFQVLRRPGNNLLQGATVDVQRAFRKSAIEAILATDMSAHFDHIKKVSRRMDESQCNAAGSAGLAVAAYGDRAAEAELGNFVLHAIDIGGQLYPHEQADEWASRLQAEFMAQAREEARRGLEPAPHMTGLESPLRQALLQKSFMENIVQPAWSLMSRLFPDTSPLVASLAANIAANDARIAALDAASSPAAQAS